MAKTEVYRRKPISQFKTLNLTTLNSLFFSFGGTTLKLPTLNYFREYYPEEVDFNDNQEYENEIKEEREENDSDYEEIMAKKKNSKRYCNSE